MAIRSLIAIQNLLQDLDIDYSRPEFYNRAEFKQAESKDQFFLETYAEFIEVQSYSEAYLTRARTLVPRVVRYLRQELARDGRLGACIDASLSLTKILERLEIWNYVAAGSLTVDFDKIAGIGPRYWSHFAEPGSKAKAGHAWIAAPPFKVIDITLRQQLQTDQERPFLPDIVMAEKIGPVEGVSLDDMVDQDLQVKWLQQFGRLPTIQEFMRQHKGAAQVMGKFHPLAVRAEHATLKYFPCMISAPMETFEEHTSHCFSGRTTSQLYDDLCKELDKDLSHLNISGNPPV